MAFISVDYEKCKRDGICITECPFSLIVERKEDGYPEARMAAQRLCINCGHCVSACPHQALSLQSMSSADCISVKKELQITPEQAGQFLKGRRSIRAYKDKPVPREKLEQIIDTTRWAPSARNIQPVHWLVVETPDEVRKLAGLVVEWLHGMNKLPGIVSAWEQGKDMVLRGAPHLVVAHAAEDGMKPVEDCTIAMTYLDLAAHSLGLGTCWAGFLMSAAREHQPLIDELHIPEGHRVYGAMMLGYPKILYPRIPLRASAKVEWR